MRFFYICNCMIPYHDNLESERLRTRFLAQDDLNEWIEFFKDEAATEFHANPDNLTPHQRAQHWVDFTLARYASNRLGMQALIHKETGAFIGQCGLLVQEVNGLGVIEVGYHLMPQHWHKGYATEAAQLFRDHGFENGFADEIVSIIDPRNENSKRVAARNGMTLVDTSASFRGEPYNLFRITRKEWEILKGIRQG